jgi:glycogen synthase
MKVLLIGPYPPPHGGISVHVQGIHRQLRAAGVRCLVLDPGNFRNRFAFARALRRFVHDGWSVHLHTNGHNTKSWLLALLCGSFPFSSSAFRILTLHSGMAPQYLNGSSWQRWLARKTCELYQRIICVSPAIREALIRLGVPADCIELAPAFIEAPHSTALVEPFLLAWISRHRPLLSTAIFFRPEYGVDLLISAVARLRAQHPSIGCLVMGSGEQRALAEQELHKQQLEDHVLLLGDVEHSRCLDLISRCDVFVRATLDDGDSISVREARSLAVPVVASRVGNRPDGIFLFEPGNLDGLVSQLEAALGSSRPAAASTQSSIEQLIEIYRQSSSRRACA